MERHDRGRAPGSESKEFGASSRPLTPSAARPGQTPTSTAEGDGGSPEPDEPNPIYVVLGAAALIGSRLRVATERAFGAGRAILPTPARVMPQVARKRWGEAALRLDVVGRDVVSALAEQAGRIADVAGGSLARAPFVLHTVEQVVDGVQRQIIDIILPEVIDRLVANPEQIRVIIHGQSVGMAEEFARSARGRAYEGDEAVNRFLSRMLHRDRSQLDTPEAVSRDVTTATQPAQ